MGVLRKHLGGIVGLIGLVSLTVLFLSFSGAFDAQSLCGEAAWCKTVMPILPPLVSAVLGIGIGKRVHKLIAKSSV